MAEQLRCMECATPLSSDASECPNCGSAFPRGVICLGCYQMMKQSEAVRHEAQNSVTPKYFHKVCYEKVTHPYTKQTEPVGVTEPGNKRRKQQDFRNLEDILKAQAEFGRKEEARKRKERRARAISKTLRFLFLATCGFIIWGLMLNFMFGEIGLLLAFIISVLFTVEIMRENT